MERLSLVPSSCKSQVASGWVLKMIAVSAFGAIVKPCSATILGFEAEAVMPHRRKAARERRPLGYVRGAVVKTLLFD